MESSYDIGVDNNATVVVYMPQIDQMEFQNSHIKIQTGCYGPKRKGITDPFIVNRKKRLKMVEQSSRTI
jgi:hypothetical protein